MLRRIRGNQASRLSPRVVVRPAPSTRPRFRVYFTPVDDLETVPSKGPDAVPHGTLAARCACAVLRGLRPAQQEDTHNGVRRPSAGGVFPIAALWLG